MIRAKGKKNGKSLTVECEKRDGEWYYTFNGATDYDLQFELEDMIEFGPHAMLGGTFVPESDALKRVVPFDNGFFDGGVDSIEVDDIEAQKEMETVEAEFREDVVY